MQEVSNFSEEVLRSIVPVVVDFWAGWCAPCKTMLSSLETVAEKHSEIKFMKVNIEAHSEKAVEFGISSIPVLIFFKNGKEIYRITGAASVSKIEEVIVSFL